jgi:RimJ/RimL family protein N-acetyltransferase
VAEQRNTKPDAPGIPTLETERLSLRPLRGSDFEDYAALYADLEVARFIANGETWDRGRSWRHMAFAVGHWQLQGVGPWVVEEKPSRAFVGMIGFWEPATWPGFELSWHLARRFWGRGYATEAGAAALDHAFTVWRRDLVISLIEPRNSRSIRVAERIGERLQRRIEHFGQAMLVFSLDHDTWQREVAAGCLPARRAG